MARWLRRKRRVESFALEARSQDREQEVAPVLELRGSLQALFAPYLLGAGAVGGVALARLLLGVGRPAWAGLAGAGAVLGPLSLVALAPLIMSLMLAVVWLGDLCAELGVGPGLRLALAPRMLWFLEEMLMVGVGVGGTAQVVAALL